ncbi:MAG: NADP oxidoreductase [Acidobacteriia bacterium]|nr:NADP oxidoreductase [Terriglobia bacterium]
MNRKKLATVWLDGCSGCHMSILDMDERLLEIAGQCELVYSPLVDQKTFPADVDITLVEGAVSSDADAEKIRRIRARTRMLVSLGDCAVTGNVPAMRNSFGTEKVLRRAYGDAAGALLQVLGQGVPQLLPQVRPVHEVVFVDVHVPGCPPSAETIYSVLRELLAGRKPDVTSGTRFGA